MRSKAYNSRKLASTAALLALALVIGAAESAAPPFFPLLPFVRIGFSNVVILFACIAVGGFPSLIIAVAKGVLVPLFIGNPAMIMYSLSGSLISALLSIFLVKTKRLGLTSIGVLSALSHNLAQLVVASLVMETAVVWGYAPYVIIAACAAGAATGTIVFFTIKIFPTKLIP